MLHIEDSSSEDVSVYLLFHTEFVVISRCHVWCSRYQTQIRSHTRLSNTSRLLDTVVQDTFSIQIQTLSFYTCTTGREIVRARDALSFWNNLVCVWAVVPWWSVQELSMCEHIVCWLIGHKAFDLPWICFTSLSVQKFLNLVVPTVGPFSSLHVNESSLGVSILLPSHILHDSNVINTLAVNSLDTCSPHTWTPSDIPQALYRRTGRGKSV